MVRVGCFRDKNIIKSYIKLLIDYNSDISFDVMKQSKPLRLAPILSRQKRNFL